jgi:hypothetical protein
MEKLPLIVGLAWFHEESYVRIWALFADRNERFENFRDWIESASQIEQIQKAQGFRVIRIYVDAYEFPAWCSRNFRDIDSKAVIDYAGEKAAEVLFREIGEHGKPQG